MKVRVFLFFVLIHLSLSAQVRNYDQELCNLLGGQKIFEASDFYNQYRDSLRSPFSSDFYIVTMDIHSNRADSALVHIPRFIDKYYGSNLNDDTRIYFLNQMLDICVKNGKTDAALNILKKPENAPIWGRVTQSYTQELHHLLGSQKIFEALDYYNQYKDILQDPFSTDFYTVTMDLYLNRPDSALVHIPQFIDKYHGTLLTDDACFHFLNQALDLCLKMDDYSAISTALEKIEASPAFDRNHIQEIERLKEKCRLKKQFPFEIINEAPGTDACVKIKTDILVMFDAKLNNTTIPIIFDTGCGYNVFMTRKIANEVKLKMLEEYKPKIINKKEVIAASGIIDSLRIGSVLIKNVIVEIIDDSYFLNISDSIQDDKKENLRRDSILQQIKVIMGPNLMKVFSSVQLDMEHKEMIFSLDHKPTANKNKEPNMYINSTLFVKAKVNNLDFTSFWDTGGNLKDDILMISQGFYQKNQPYFSIKDSIRNNEECSGDEGLSTCFYLKPEKLEFQMGDNILDLHKETIILSGKEKGWYFKSVKEGLVGFGFLNKIKKITFDFHSMQMAFLPKNEKE